MILLIGLKTLKEQYLIDDNLEDKYILSIIKKGQDFILRKVLGSDKLEQLLNDVENDSVSNDDDILIKIYIQPILAYYTMSEVVYSTAYKLKNNPEYQLNPNSTRFDELIRISKHYLIDSQNYEQILRDYICENNIILPTSGIEKPLKSGYKTGINID